MSKYEPGTVAVATVRGVAGVQVIRTCDHPDGGKGWVSATSVAAHYTHHDHNVTDIRPLVVLDLADAPEGDDMKYGAWLRGSASIDESHLGRGNYRPTFLRWVADQIEAQAKPPRIPEPGLWGVVEASVENRPRGRFVHDEECTWAALDWPGDYFWNSLIDPTLIREGLS